MPQVAFDLQKYAQSKWVNFDEVIQKLQLPDDSIVFVTGSLLDGVGDSQSDLDIYAFTPDAYLKTNEDKFDSERSLQQKRRNFGIRYIEVGPTELDIEIHPLSKLEEMLNTLNRFDPADEQEIISSYDSLGRFERAEALELLHRFRIGVAIYNEKKFIQLRDQFDEEKFFTWNRNYNLIQVKDFTKGTTRSLNQNDLENSYLKLTRLYDALIDVYLFSIGQSLDRWKWRLPKLKLFGPSELLEDYLDVQLLRKNPETELGIFIKENLTKSQTWVDKIRN